MQGKTVMSCQRSLANDAGGCCWCYVLQCYAYTMLLYVLYTFWLMMLGGAGGVMTPGLLTHRPPLPGPGVGDDE